MSDNPFVYKNIVIDGNNLFHRNHEKLKHMTYTVGNNSVVTGGIYGSIRSVWSLERKFLESSDDATIFILFDNAKSKENMRKEIDPSYKLNRESKPPEFYRAIDYFRFILLHSAKNYVVVYGTGYEADDIAPVVLNFIKNGDTTLVVSEDLDWARLINFGGRTVHHHMKGKVYNKSTFNKEYDFEPSESKIVLYKSIRGDTSDNIPVGVPHMKEKDVIEIVEGVEDVFELLEVVDELDFLSSNMRQKIKDNAARLKLNHQLASFIPLEHKDIENHIFRGWYNPSVLLRTYEALGFNVEEFDKRVKDYIDNKYQSYNKDDFFTTPRIKHS